MTYTQYYKICKQAIKKNREAYVYIDRKIISDGDYNLLLDQSDGYDNNFLN
jgi:hypothetical protein